MEEEITIIEPIRYAQFNTIESYNAVNLAIAAWKDQQTNGEYSRTDTSYEYEPNPEPEWNGMFYMPAKPEQVEAGLFNGVTLLDAIPVQVEIPTIDWLKADIQTWLTGHGINWNISMTKEELIGLIQI